MYILCFDQKSLLRGSFEALQRWRKGVSSKIGITFWSQIYAYILSMGKDRIVVENTHSFAFFCAARRWTANGVGAVHHHPAIDPLSTARDPIAQ